MAPPTSDATEQPVSDDAVTSAMRGASAARLLRLLRLGTVDGAVVETNMDVNDSRLR